MALKELAKAVGSQPTGPGETAGGGAQEMRKETLEEHKRAWPPPGEELHRWEPGEATWLATTGCGKMPRPTGPHQQVWAPEEHL